MVLSVCTLVAVALRGVMVVLHRLLHEATQSYLSGAADISDMREFVHAQVVRPLLAIIFLRARAHIIVAGDCSLIAHIRDIARHNGSGGALGPVDASLFLLPTLGVGIRALLVLQHARRVNGLARRQGKSLCVGHSACWALGLRGRRNA